MVRDCLDLRTILSEYLTIFFLGDIQRTVQTQVETMPGDPLFNYLDYTPVCLEVSSAYCIVIVTTLE